MTFSFFQGVPLPFYSSEVKMETVEGKERCRLLLASVRPVNAAQLSACFVTFPVNLVIELVLVHR